MRLPIDVTTTGPLYHSERLRHLDDLDVLLGATDARFVEECADLLEQYRTALLDIYVLAAVYTKPDQHGSPLDQVAWIALHRGLGKPIGDDHYPLPSNADNS